MTETKKKKTPKPRQALRTIVVPLDLFWEIKKAAALAELSTKAFVEQALRANVGAQK
jgi:hypothetical protein